MDKRKSLFTFRIPAELNEKFTKHAKKRGFSKNTILIILLEKFLEDDKAQLTNSSTQL